MKKQEIKEVKIDYYECDQCNKKIIQDGKNISLIQDPDKKVDYAFHFHTTCLVEHLKKTFVSNS